MKELNKSEETFKKVLEKYFKRLVDMLQAEHNFLSLKIIDCKIHFTMKKQIHAILKIMEMFHEKLSIIDEFLVYRVYRAYNLMK